MGDMADWINYQDEYIERVDHARFLREVARRMEAKQLKNKKKITPNKKKDSKR